MGIYSTRISRDNPQDALGFHIRPPLQEVGVAHGCNLNLEIQINLGILLSPHRVPDFIVFHRDGLEIETLVVSMISGLMSSCTLRYLYDKDHIIGPCPATQDESPGHQFVGECC